MKSNIKNISFLILLLLPFLSLAQTGQLLTSITIQVDGVCGMCEDRIEETALNIKGVEKADWNTETTFLNVQVQDDKFQLMQLHKALSGAGHRTNVLEADVSAYDDLPFCCQYDHPDNPHKQNEQEKDKEFVRIAIRVAGACGMCKDRIEETALNHNGISYADWDVESNYLTIEYEKDNFDEMGLHKGIADAGHETDLYDANAEAYANLPMCCQYMDPENIHKNVETTEETSIESENSGEETTYSGQVFEKNESDDLLPLIGANLYWLESGDGVSTDLEGNFEIQAGIEDQNLIISYVGYESDTLLINREEATELDVILSHANNLDIIEIVHRQKSTELSLLDPIKVQKIGEDELMKAACCNLSESFTTTPAVDVSFTDAVTGTRKIEMLGLAGKYVQIMSESLPDARALSSINGLTYVPGPWIQGIQLNMGTGSVVNGFESMTGQINVELRKPWETDKLYLNLYGSLEGRMEANLNVSHVIDEQWSTGLLMHAHNGSIVFDQNNDGFVDMPIGGNYTVMNRWKFLGKNGLMSQIAVKTTQVDKISGQKEYFENRNSEGNWSAFQKTNRTEAWFKLGKIFQKRPQASIGFQLHGVVHDQEYSFGFNPYDALQKSLFANLIYQDNMGNSSHQYRTGLSFHLDNIEENVSGDMYSRNENIPGAYFEYTFKPNEKFSLVSGIRGDLHNNYGFFYTPRLNMKYAPADNTVFRLAAGKGQRTASIFAENIGLFASSRDFIIKMDNEENPYGLSPEVAWNFGLNFTQVFYLFGGESVIAIDAYHTNFENQIVIDIENTREVNFYNLEGKSYSNSIQLQVDLNPFENFDIRMAYRFNDVKTDYNQGLLQKALSSRHRAFINLAYETKNNWSFDMTLNWQGQKRLPDTSMNPEGMQLGEYSPNFYLMNAQVSKKWDDYFEIYVGGENLLNFRQDNPIIDAANPFGEYFDSSLIWGPVFGRNVYVGVRYRIK